MIKKVTPFRIISSFELVFQIYLYCLSLTISVILFLASFPPKSHTVFPKYESASLGHPTWILLPLFYFACLILSASRHIFFVLVVPCERLMMLHWIETWMQCFWCCILYASVGFVLEFGRWKMSSVCVVTCRREVLISWICNKLKYCISQTKGNQATWEWIFLATIKYSTNTMI